jgi:hypothetical protein
MSWSRYGPTFWLFVSAELQQVALQSGREQLQLSQSGPPVLHLGSQLLA